MAVTKAGDSLKRAWDLRFRQRNREARALLDELDRSREPLSADTRLDAELLRVSLLRAEGHLEKSNALLESLAPDATIDKARVPFQFHLQKALNLFKADDFAMALEYFLLADRHAPSSVQRVVCLMNVLSCMDNLGLPWSGVLAELERELPKAKRSESAFVTAVEEQLRTVRIGDAFRAMDFKALFSAPAPAEFDQAEYQRLFASKLPFVTTKWDSSQSLESLARTDSFHMKGYRLATLRFTSDVREVGRVETAQQVDRLYLWTWAWLREPTPKRASDLARCLEAIDFSAALKTMTWEDTQMMRNALGWIATFQKDLAPWIDRYLETIPHSELETFAIFAHEARWISAFRSGDIASIVSLQSEKKRGVDFGAALAQGKASVLAMRTSLPKAAILVNERTNEISKGRTRTQSAPLVSLVRTLTEKGSLSFADVLWIGFEIAPYDSSVHMPKIYNLIARLKTFLPKAARVTTKGGVLHLEGSLRGLEVVTLTAHERPLLASGFSFAKKAVSAPVKTSRAVHPRTLLAKSPERDQWTREEIQTLLRTSKAGTQRWIRRWESQGFVQRQGAGKASVYRIELARHLRLSDSV